MYVVRHEKSSAYFKGITINIRLAEVYFNCICHLFGPTWNMLHLSGTLTYFGIELHLKMYKNLLSECAQNNGIWAITSFSICLKYPLWKIVASTTNSAFCLKLFMVYAIFLPILLFPTVAPHTLLDLSAFINPSLTLPLSILLSFLTLYGDEIICQKTPSALPASPLLKTLFMFSFVFNQFL